MSIEDEEALLHSQLEALEGLKNPEILESLIVEQVKDALPDIEILNGKLERVERDLKNEKEENKKLNIIIEYIEERFVPQLDTPGW